MCIVFFQKISIPYYGRFFSLNPYHQEISVKLHIYLDLKSLSFETSLPFRISNNLPWVSMKFPGTTDLFKMSLFAEKQQ